MRILIKYNFKDVISDYLNFEQICSLLLSSCVWIYWECNWILSTQFGISKIPHSYMKEDKTKCDVCICCHVHLWHRVRRFLQGILLIVLGSRLHSSTWGIYPLYQLGTSYQQLFCSIQKFKNQLLFDTVSIQHYTWYPFPFLWPSYEYK